MITVPVEIEDALWEAARAQLPAEALGAGLAAAVMERSRRYTSERERLAAPAGPRDLAARALFFTIADIPKAIAVLREIPIDWERPLHLLDLGAGAGAMSLGARTLARAPLTVDAFDRDAGALAILEHAVGALAATVRVHRGDVARAALPPADLALLGSVLNELDEPAALALVERALAAAPIVAIIEPALRTTARALHRLRAAAIARGANVFAPCTHEGPCPMLADERDWCHEERVARLPPRAAHLATTTGLRDGATKFSYLVLRREPGHVGGVADAVRVVGHPHRSKGKLEAPVCGVAGLVPVRLLTRHRGPATRALERARRGDVLREADGAWELLVPTDG